jgi:hypothetical protein
MRVGAHRRTLVRVLRTVAEYFAEPVRQSTELSIQKGGGERGAPLGAAPHFQRTRTLAGSIWSRG